MFSTVNPLASSFTSSITSSLASSVGSESSSPTTLSTMNAKATPFYPGSNTVESVIGTSLSGPPAVGGGGSCDLTGSAFLPGSALDLNFSDINVASLDRELEERDSSVGMPSEDQLIETLPS